MIGILSDADLIGIVRTLIRTLESSEFAPLWVALKLRVAEFGELGLTPNTPDRIVWEYCQRHGLVLVTGNRNHDGPDSLEATIRASNTPTSLPVFTIGSAQRVQTDRHYAERVALDLLDYLGVLKKSPADLSGTGRLFLPKNAIT